MDALHAPLDPNDESDLSAEPAPRISPELPGGARLRALADSLDCVLDSDLCELARVKPTTTEAWRKRGVGPPYVLLGNRYLYPREGLRKHLSRLLRDRTLPARSLL
jgi:hypothetical protein